MVGAESKTVARAAVSASTHTDVRSRPMRPGPPVQMSSLRVSSPRDAAEREAEATARRVVRAPPGEVAAGRFADARAALQRATATPQTPSPRAVPPATRAAIESATGGGAPLPAAVRRFMEPRFRADFGGVRVHTDGRAAALARQMHARAFTVGRDVFFGQGEYRPDTDDGRELIAHELTHTLQQGAVPRREGGPATEPTERHVQRALFDFDLSGVLDFFADAANAIPGFRLLTVVIGVNPINRAPVERSAANVLRAAVEFLPGGALLSRALDAYGVFDRAGAWLDERLGGLGVTAASLRRAVDTFVRGLGAADIVAPWSAWERARTIFAAPAGRILGFLRDAAADVLKFVRDAVLRPLGALAARTRGWDLLRALLGRDPITGEEVPRTPEALIGGFMKLIGQEEVWQNVQRARAIPRAWAWFQGALDGLRGFARELPLRFSEAFARLRVEDLLDLPGAFASVARVFGDFALRFARWAGETVWTLLEIVFDVVAPGVLVYLRRAASAFRSILENPLRFVGNLIRAGLRGLKQFAENFLGHLRGALIGWLTGAMSGANIYVPQSLAVRELVRFVLSVLGLTWQNVRQKLVRAVGPTAVAAMERGFELVKTLVTEGPAAAWEKLKENLADLRQMVMEQIMTFVAEKVVTAAITKLLMMLDPSGIGAVIQAVIAIYNTVMFFVERMRQMAQVAASFIDSIAAIAAGNLAAAASRVETTMAGLLTLVISFLARLAGLGRVSDAVTRVVDRIRAPIDKALDKVIDWIVASARRLGRFVAQAGVPQDPNERLRLAGEAAVAAAKRLSGRVTRAMLDPVLAVIKVRYGLTELRPYEKGGTWWVHLKVNPEGDKDTGAVAGSEGTRDKPIDIDWVKPNVVDYPKIRLVIDNVTKTVGPLEETKVGSITIGIKNAVARGKKHGFVFQAGDAVKSDSVKNKVNSVLKAHGYSRHVDDGGSEDTDHVWEKQLGGPDHEENLWPLNSSVNRSSGSTVRDRISKIKERLKVQTLKGLYLRIRQV